MTSQSKKELRALFKRLQGTFPRLRGWAVSFPRNLTIGRFGGYCNRKTGKLEIQPLPTSPMLDMKIILVHEVVHVLTTPDHDSIFCDLFRRLLKRWVGENGYTLVRDSFGNYRGVKTKTSSHDMRY